MENIRIPFSTSNNQMTDENPTDLAEAKRYQRIDLTCDLADRAIDLTYMLVASFVIAAPLAAWLAGSLSSYWLQFCALYAIVFCIHVLVSLPLSYYSGFSVEHQFGMSKQTVGRWFTQYLKKLALASVFGLLFFMGLFAMMRWLGGWWWLCAAGAYFVVSIVIGKIVPVLIMPLFHKIEPLEDTELQDRFAKLADGTGLQIEGVYRMEMSNDTVKANAMLAGMGGTRRVILTDTLLDEFSTEEIEVVLAHEVGHHVFRHLWILMVVGIFVSAGSFYLCHQAIVWFGGEGFAYAELPTSMLPLLMLCLMIINQGLEPMMNAISRHFERQSDRYALESTKLFTPFRSAFHKLASQNKADPDPHPLEVFLFHDHPAIKERLALADTIEAES